MVNRRKFLQYSGTVATSSLVIPRRIIGRPMANSKVYTIKDEKFVQGTSTSSPVDYARIKAGYDQAVMAMTGKKDVAEAWKTLFAGATANSSVAIKVNCLRKTNAPRWESMKALVASLTSVFKASNIYVFDNNRASSNDRAVDVYNKSGELKALGVWHGKCSYNGPAIKVGTETWRPATQLAQADYGISFGVYRQHCCHAGFLSAGIKNMLGAISTKTDTYSAVNSFHGDFNGGKGVFYKYADLYKNGLHDLVHLYISDWLFTAPDETKPVSKVTYRLAFSTDPCAIDSYSVDYFKSVNMLKKGTKGVPAELQKAGIGNTAYDLVPFSIGGAVPVSHIASPAKQLTVSLWTPNYNYSTANFLVSADEAVDYIGVYNMQGRRLRAFRPSQGKRRILFDGRNERGQLLPEGSYALRLTTTRGRIVTNKLSIASW